MGVAAIWSSSEGCNTLSHEGLANVNIRKRMLYRHCYIPSFQAHAVPNNLINYMQQRSPKHHEAYYEITLDRRQLKTSILLMIVDQK